MGITSSSDAVIKQVRSRIVGDVWGYMLEDSVGEIMKKELLEKFTDIVTEPYGRIDEFARGGACKELFRAMGDCVDENGYGNNKCGEQAEKMYNCMCSHPDYYQPMLASFKTVGEHIVKEHDVYLTRKQALTDDALAGFLTDDALAGFYGWIQKIWVIFMVYFRCQLLDFGIKLNNPKDN